jgi:mono/diheme cytochrome c family protein
LLAKLDHPNGWWRDRAQQLLVESRNAALAPRLREMVKATKTVGARGRLHALWTLEGLEQVDLATLEAATEDPSPEVRAAGLRLIDGQLRGTQREQAMLLLMRRAGFLSGPEQLQLLFTLTTAATPQADTVLRVLLMNGASSTLRQDAAISGLGGRELEFLEGLLSDPICGPEKQEHAALVKRLAQCVAIEGKPARVDRMLEVASLRKTGDWQQLALLDGLVSTVPAVVKGRPAPAVKPVRFASQPKGWEALQRIELPQIRERLDRVAPMIAWVGDGKTPVETKVRELSESEEASFKRGKELYMVVCGACHQPHGNGQEGLAPPLKESEWVLGSEARMVRMVLHGVRDAITVKGQKWELNMPAFNEALEDQQIADSLTYVRREWGNTAAPVSVETVKRIRAETAGREDSWTEAELLKVP